MKASLSVITTACLMAFLTLSTSDASPTFTQDGQIRLKTPQEIEKEAKQSQAAFLARRAEMKKQLENEISVTEARFQAKKAQLEKDMMKKKSQMVERHEKLTAEWEKMSHSKQDLDEASMTILKKAGDRFAGKK
mmetsp:Transcript_2737/g.3895  ORF Transcript_2737/g.3895 Transcript_2737/m.3895 type:complete len:134 (-) Transcript_2737:196-597(-)